MIPQSLVDSLLGEFTKIATMAQESRKKSFIDKLNALGASDTVVNEVIKINNNDPMIRAHSSLDTAYKREKFMEQNFNYIHPREIVLNQSEVNQGKV